MTIPYEPARSSPDCEAASTLRYTRLLPEKSLVGRDEVYDAPARGNVAARKFAQVQGIVFDMGDVLFDATAWRRRLLQVLHHMGLRAGYRSLFELWDRDYLDAVHRGERRYDEAFDAFLRDAGLTAGQRNETTTAAKQLAREIVADTQLFPGVAATLRRLRDRRLRLAVLSDSESPSAHIAARLERMGLPGIFTAVVSSVELRRTKPHLLCYQTAAEQMGLSCEQLAFVGHDAEELLGARRAGMCTIAFNYDRNASADCRLGRFEDLFALFADRATVDPSARRAA